MKSSIYRWAAYLQIGLVLFSTGCHPTQPFFVNEGGDLAHYLNRATQIEYPDVNVESLPEATDSWAPLTVGNDDYEFVDLSLEDCINYALANSKLIPTLPGTILQTNDLPAQILSTPSSQLRTNMDNAITSSTANTQPLVIDQNGNRTLPRGAIRANQVGGVEDALSEFDAQYSTFLSYNTTDRQRNANNIFTPAFFQARDTTYQNALSKRLATGTVVTGRAQTIYSANNVPTTNGGTARVVPSDYTQVLEIQVQQPMMRGRGALVNRIPVVLARINEDISMGTLEESARNLVRDVENAYWELYCSYWALETAKLGHDSALRVYQVASAKAESGIQEAGQAHRAKQQAHQFEGQINAALNGIPNQDPGLKNREAELRFLIGWATADGRLIRPSDRPSIARFEHDWEMIKSEALARNLELRQQKWTIKQKELELVSAKNQILPDFNISGTYRWVGTGDDWFGNKGQNLFPGPAGTNGVNTTSAWKSLYTGDFQEVGFRAEFIPNAIGARRAHALIRNSQLSLAREHAVLQQKEIALGTSIGKVIRAMDSTYKQMQIKLNEWSEAEADVKVQNDRYQGGAADISQLVSELLQAQQRRARSQQEYYRAVCEYNKAIVQFHLLKGSLLDYNSIVLEEGQWAEKAYWDANERARERNAARHLNYGSSRPAVVSTGPVKQGARQMSASQEDSYEVVSPSDQMQEESPSKSKDTEEGARIPAETMEPTPDSQAGSYRVKSRPVSTSDDNSSNAPSGQPWKARSSRSSTRTNPDFGADNTNRTNSPIRQASFDESTTSSLRSAPVNRFRDN